MFWRMPFPPSAEGCCCRPPVVPYAPCPVLYCPVAYGLVDDVPVHAGEEAFAALEQSVVCEVEPLSRNWAFAVIVPAHNSAATKERNLRGI